TGWRLLAAIIRGFGWRRRHSCGGSSSRQSSLWPCCSPAARSGRRPDSPQPGTKADHPRRLRLVEIDPGEKHGLRQRENQKHWTVHLAEYFDHYLKDAPRPDWMEKGVPYLEKGKRDVSTFYKK